MNDIHQLNNLFTGDLQYNDSRHHLPFHKTNDLCTSDTVGSSQANLLVTNHPGNEWFQVLPEQFEAPVLYAFLKISKVRPCPTDVSLLDVIYYYVQALNLELV